MGKNKRSHLNRRNINGDGTDDYGFSALPGGSFGNVGNVGFLTVTGGVLRSLVPAKPITVAWASTIATCPGAMSTSLV